MARGQQVVESAVRSLLGATPYIGTLLTEMLYEHRARIKQARLQLFTEALAVRLEAMGLVDRFGALLSDEAFSDFVEGTLRRVAYAGDEERRRRLGEAVVHQVQGGAAEHRELFLDLVVEFSEIEVVILARHRDRIDALRAEPGYDHDLYPKGSFREAADYGMSEDDYVACVNHLVSRGLMIDDGVGRWSTAANTIFDISPLGRKFLAFLLGPQETS